MRPFLPFVAASLTALAAGEVPVPVYVPFDDGKLPKNLTGDRAVLVPYAAFQQLWERANPDARPPASAEPPVAATAAGYQLDGTVRATDATVALRLDLTAVGAGWSSVVLPGDLPLATVKASDPRILIERVTELDHRVEPGQTLAAICKLYYQDEARAPAIAARNRIRAGDEPATGSIVSLPGVPGGVPRLRVHLPAAGSWRVDAELALPVAKDATGRRTVVVPAPAAAAGRLDLLIPDAEADVQLDRAAAYTVEKTPQGTRLRAVLGGHDRIGVSWQPPAAAVAGEALLLAQVDVRLTAAERSLRWECGLDVEVQRRSVRELAVRLPADAQVLLVEGASLRTWEVADRVLTVRLHEPVEGRWRGRLRLERLLPALPPGGSHADLAVELPQVVGAARSTGVVAIDEASRLSATVAVGRHDGLMQVDPQELKIKDAVAAFRYLAPPPAAVLTITRPVSELRAQLAQVVRLGADEDQIALTVAAQVAKAPVFALDLVVPEAWELTDAGAVDDVRRGEAADGVRTLTLVLRSQLIGSGSLTLRFRAPPSIPRDGAAVERLPLRAALLGGARQVRGDLLVVAPRAWALTAGARQGLTGAEIAAVRHDAAIAALLGELKDGEEAAQAWRFLVADSGATTPNAAATAPMVTVAAAARPRELTVRHEERLLVADGSLKRTITWRGEVRYAAAASLTVVAPTALDGALVFKGAQLVDQVATRQEDGTTRWELRFQAPVEGAFTITAEATVRQGALAAGAPAAWAVPPIGVRDATRTQVVVAVARQGTLDVAVAAPALESLAAADVPGALAGAGVVAGFQGMAVAPLTLTLTRHDLVALADGSVPRAAWRAVLGEDGDLRVQGDLELVHRGRPWLELHLPSGAQVHQVVVAGRSRSPSRRADGTLVIGLDGVAAGTVPVAVVYQHPLPGGVPGWGGVELGLPRLGGGEAPLPVGLTTLDLWLPPRLRLVASGGDLRAAGARTDLWSRLCSRVLARAGTPVPAPAVRTADDQLAVRFAFSGVRHRFERLGDGGTLRATVVGRGWLDALALALALAGGVGAFLLRRRHAALAGLGLAALVAALTASGAWLLPALALVGGVVAGLVPVVAAALRRRLADWRQRRQQPPPAPPAPPAEADPFIQRDPPPAS